MPTYSTGRDEGHWPFMGGVFPFVCRGVTRPWQNWYGAIWLNGGAIIVSHSFIVTQISTAEV